MRGDLKFLLAIWKANLLSVMEYRISFLTQVFGMILNDAMYFLVWVIFFQRFQSVRGWGVTDMFITFGITASAVGLVNLLFGNVPYLGDIIVKGRLDYYLSLPRPVLLHVAASRSVGNGAGDLIYGLISYLASGAATFSGILRFFLAVLCAAAVFSAFLIIIQSLTFWIGNTAYLSAIAFNAMVTFAIYPITLFDSIARLILFTLVPAALMGAVPAEYVRAFQTSSLIEMTAGALVLLALAVIVFTLGLRRYESGSAIQIEI